MNGKDQTDVFAEYKKNVENLAKLDTEKLVEIAEKVGKETAGKKISTSQIRRFLDGVRRIDTSLKQGNKWDSVKAEVVLLRPKLAYAAGRHRNLKPFAEFLDVAVKSGCQSEDNFRTLLRLIESIMAYHRFYGGD
jgi:CRISPR-associated protein Csm2